MEAIGYNNDTHPIPKVRTSLLCAALTHLVLFATTFMAFIAIFNWANPEAGAKNAARFQWHPVLMISAYVLFMGEAIIAYRILPFEHSTQKAIHGVLMAAALVTSSVGIWMIVSFHKALHYDDYYDLHNILGIGTFGLFIAQFMGGFVFFALSWLFPSFPGAWRAMAMPYHRFVGVVLFFLTYASILTGFMNRQRLQFPASDDYTPPYNTMNAAGLMVALSAVVILYHFSPVAKKEDTEGINQRLLP